MLEPEMLAAPKRTSEPRVSVVAGEGFGTFAEVAAPGCLQARLPFAA